MIFCKHLTVWRWSNCPTGGASSRLPMPNRISSVDTSPTGKPRHDDPSSGREGASGPRDTSTKGQYGLATLVQETLKKDPFSGHLFAFGGMRASVLKILFWDGNGLCLFSKRLDQGLHLAQNERSRRQGQFSPAQLAMPIEGIDWRAPERRWCVTPSQVTFGRALNRRAAEYLSIRLQTALAAPA
jgi:transposase